MGIIYSIINWDCWLTLVFLFVPMVAEILTGIGQGKFKLINDVEQLEAFIEVR